MAGLYIHIPFCGAKCAYCDFYSGPFAVDHSRYIAAGARELELRRDEPGAVNPTTLYIGGGTPSLLTADEFTALASRLPDLSGVEEFTIEVNPDDVTDERVDAWMSAGVNRVSMGVQSLDDEVLKRVGRRHTARMAIDAYVRLRRHGIDNISLDLIYGLPSQSLDSWKNSLDGVLALRPEHLSAYSLSYEPGTRLYAALQVGKIKETDENTVVAMYTYLCDRMRAAGYEHYEISNFALPGCRSRHNSSYWSFTPYTGLGPGAHSFDGEVRRYNPSSLKGYLEAIESGRTAYEVDEETAMDRLNDRIMVAMRTSDGLDLSTLPVDIADRLSRLADKKQAAGLVRLGSRIFIPEDKFLVSDAIIRDLFL